MFSDILTNFQSQEEIDNSKVQRQLLRVFKDELTDLNEYVKVYKSFNLLDEQDIELKRLELIGYVLQDHAKIENILKIVVDNLDRDIFYSIDKELAVTYLMDFRIFEFREKLFLDIFKKIEKVFYN